MKRISVHIKPNCKHLEQVVRLGDNEYQVSTKSPAVEGKANMAAIKLLADHFGVPKTRVVLIRGATSRVKIFEIQITLQYH